jgi:heterodisulfide reductase subunit A
MYLTKEAIVTKEHHPEINVTILYNDIRATGKNHDEFIRRATEEFGVKHVKGLPGSVLYDPPTGTYIVRYSDLTTSELNSLQADMIVLSPAVCPSKDSLKLSEILGIEVDKHGFFKAKNEITSIQTRVPGIYICGACQEPKDISSSVTQASGAAALAALRARSPRIKVTKIPTPSLIHKEEPRIGVFVCHCGWNIAAVIDSYEVAVYASKLPNVFHSEDLMFACSKDAQSKIKEAIEKYKLNRVVVAACTPRTHEPLFRKTCMEAGLNPYLFELVNIREHDSWVHSGKPEEATSKAKDLVRMAIARSSFLEPLEDYEVEVEPSAMVIGGGLAGITAALTIADKGFKVYLVEKDPKLGGRLHKEQYRIPFTEIDPTDYLEPLIENIKNHKNVEILTSSTIKEVCGSVGNFKVSLSSQGANKEIKVGTIILSVGAEELKPMKLYGYGEHKNVQTILEFRKMLKEVKSNERIAIILCAGARGKEGITYCGATCCSEAVDLALELKTLHPNTQIYALYRDIRVSFIGEEYYRKAREKGVVFIRYDETRMPAVNFRNDNVSIKVYDSILQNYIELDVDRIVLATPVAPSSTNQKIREILKVPLNMNGFFLEAHPKLRPVDFSNEGIYLCGSAYGAQSPVESVSQAFASASRALIPLTQGKVFSEGIISEVNPDICIGCGNCVAACQYGAISIEIKNHVAKVNPLLCKGCGVCAVECPARAIRMRHFTDQQITAMIKAALETITEEPKIIAFFCNWCAYAGADTAGVSRFQYPPTTRIIRVMCSGRVEQSYILEALRNGADGVLVGGCHPGTCHYVSGNVKAEQRIRALQTLLKSTGVEPQRVRLEWFSAGEGKRVADIMTSFSEEIKKLGPNPFRQLLLKHA